MRRGQQRVCASKGNGMRPACVTSEAIAPHRDRNAALHDPLRRTLTDVYVSPQHHARAVAHKSVDGRLTRPAGVFTMYRSVAPYVRAEAQRTMQIRGQLRSRQQKIPSGIPVLREFPGATRFAAASRALSEFVGL